MARPLSRSAASLATTHAAPHALSRLGLLLALGCGLSAAAQAQSLRELVDAARGFDASYLSARALADSAQYRAAQADALTRPSAALAGALNRTQVDRPSGALGSTAGSLGVSGKYPLFNRSNTATQAQAQQVLAVSKYDLITAEQALIISVTQAYFDVLTAQDALGTVRAGKAAISEQLASAKRNFEVGTATITDTREAQARFDLVNAQELAAVNDLQTRQAALDQAVGRSNVSPRALAVPVQLPATLPADVNAWLTRADAEHPGIRRAQLASDIARLETDKAKAADGATVDAVASLSLGHSDGKFSSPQKGNTTTGVVGLQLNMPLYTGGAAQNRVKETLALEDKARNDLDAARRTVALGTRQVYLGVQSGQAQVKALEAAESSSKLALDATQLGYKVGVRVNLDVLNAQTQLFQTRRDLAKARYDVLVNSLKLRQAAGTLTVDDVNAVNQLLAP
jgi:outer membrane protein